MHNIEGGYILNSNDVVEKNKVKFQINIKTNYIIIDFVNEVTIIDEIIASFATVPGTPGTTRIMSKET